MICFGPFTFESTTGSLWRGTELLPLLPKDAAVLAVLVQHAGHIVPKEMLLEAVWPETYVTETVLKNSIARLRRMLGDDPKTPQYIATRARRGYRFLGLLEPPAPEGACHEPTSAVVQPMAPFPMVHSDMVGREPALALLHERFALALGGQRQVVWITGEAGIGKTTLLETFVAQVTAQESLWLGYGQCVEHYGEGEPYRPVLEAVDRLCRRPDGQRLLALLRQEAPLWLAQLPGILSAAEIEALEHHTSQTTPARMQRELVVALDRFSAEIPLVLVLEDLHWSDYATLDLLSVLTQRRDPARLLVLGTYRPTDLQARAHPLSLLVQRLARYAHCYEMALSTLAEVDIAAYLTQRLSVPTWPPRALRWLHQRSGGNPLFLVTLVDYLVQYEGLEASPHIVYTGSAPNQQILPGVKWAFDHLGKRFFLVGSDYVFPRTANAIIMEQLAALGGQVLGEAYILLGSTEVRQMVRSIVEAQPEVILNTINGDSNVAFFRELRAAGVTPQRIPTLSFSIAEHELQTMGVHEMVGDYAAWSYFQSVESPENTRFVQRFRTQYGLDRVTDDPIQAGYFGVYLWAQGVRDAGTPAPEAVRRTIGNQSFTAPEGIVYVDAENQHTWKTVRIGQVREDGQFAILWTSERAIRPLPYPAFRLKAAWDRFLDDLYRGWGGHWAQPGP